MQSGYGLKSLKKQQHICLTRTFTTQIANGIDSTLSSVAMADPDNSYMSVIQQAAKEYNIKFQLGNEDPYNIFHYLDHNKIAKKIKNFSTSDIRDYITNTHKITDFKDAKFKYLTEDLKKHIKDMLCDSNATSIRQGILIKIGKLHFANKGKKSLVAFTDGSTKNGEATYSIYYDKNNQWNYTQKTFLKENQSNVNAELLAIHHVVKANPIETKLTIYSDSKVNIDLIQKFMTEPNLITEDPILQETITTIKNRNAPTKIQHVYSHLIDEKEIPNKDKKMAKMVDLYGAQSMSILKGNQEADHLAETGHSSLIGRGPGTRTSYNLTLTHKEKECTHRFNREIERIISEEYEIKEKINQSKGNKAINKTLFSSIKYEHSSVQDFCFKLTTDKLPTRSRVTDPKRMKLHTDTDNNKRSKLLASKNCPMGCNVPETIDHIYRCPYTINIAKELPRTILHTINKHLEKANKKTIKFFPSFYWTHGRTTNHFIDNSTQAFRKLSECNPQDTLAGAIPTTLNQALKEVGLPSKSRNKCAMQIQSDIINNVYDRWKKRCQKLYGSR